MARGTRRADAVASDACVLLCVYICVLNKRIREKRERERCDGGGRSGGCRRRRRRRAGERSNGGKNVTEGGICPVEPNMGLITHRDEMLTRRRRGRQGQAREASHCAIYDMQQQQVTRDAWPPPSPPSPSLHAQWPEPREAREQATRPGWLCIFVSIFSALTSSSSLSLVCLPASTTRIHHESGSLV